MILLEVYYIKSKEDGTVIVNMKEHSSYTILWKVSGKKQITITYPSPSYFEDFVYKVVKLTSKELILDELAKYSNEVVGTMRLIRSK